MWTNTQIKTKPKPEQLVKIQNVSSRQFDLSKKPLCAEYKSIITSGKGRPVCGLTWCATSAGNRPRVTVRATERAGELPR